MKELINNSWKIMLTIEPLEDLYVTFEIKICWCIIGKICWCILRKIGWYTFSSYNRGHENAFPGPN